MNSETESIGLLMNFLGVDILFGFWISVLDVRLLADLLLCNCMIL